jgi:peptide/nickel transport system substrate-binding protein
MIQASSSRKKGELMRARIKFFLLITLASLLAVGCQEKPSAISPSSSVAMTRTPVPANVAPLKEVPTTQQIAVLTGRSVSTLDPCLMVYMNPDESIAAHIWDTLVWIRDDFDLEPRLAKSWRLVNDLTWELELRQGVTFHNGEPFDAQAVKYSLERTANLEGSLETFACDVALQGVEIIDDYTVRIQTADPAVSMIYELATVEMLPPTYYAQTPPEDLAHNPVGSGPYQLVGWDPSGRVVLEANADYWRGAPAVHTLVFQAEADVDQRLARLTDGEADLVSDLPPEQASSAETKSTQLRAIESTRRLFVGLRAQEGTPLADKRVRQALNYAVDVQALIAKFHAGYGQRYGGWVNSAYASSELAPWPYDPAKARDLLAQAGYSDGFEVDMDTPIGRYHRDQEIAEAVADQLADVGVKVTVRPQEWSVYVRDKLVPRETAPLFLLGLMSRGDSLEDTQNLAYSFPFNPTLWHNEDFELLLDEAKQTFNQTLRLNVLRQAQAVAYEEAPWIWLWRPYLFYGVSRSLDWWQPRADGLIYLYTPLGKTTE